MKKLYADNYYYAINEDRTNKNVIKDLNVNIIKFDNSIHVENVLYKIDNDNLYINTWIGCYLGLYKKEIICDLNNLHEMFKIIYDKINIKIENIDFYIPDIDYKNVQKKDIDDFCIKNKDIKKVLISNGDVSSNQANNVNMNYLINNLSNVYKNYIFILTDDSNRLVEDNIFYTKDIINLNDCDLLEISYLSTKCDIIIGRSSGPYTYCMVKENFKNKNKKFIGICHSEREAIWFKSECEQYFIKDNSNLDDYLEKLKLII
jgi:hypothetical protein